MGDFIKPQLVSIICRTCGTVFRTKLMTELNVSAVGTLTQPDGADDQVLLPCHHWVGVRGIIPGFKPKQFWFNYRGEWTDCDELDFPT